MDSRFDPYLAMNKINETLQVIYHDHLKHPMGENNGTVEYTAIRGILNMLKDLEFISNFTSNITTKFWNDGVDDKYETEVIPAFLQGKADLAVNYYYILIPRLANSVPLHPIQYEKFWAFFRQPHFSSVKNIYTQSFSQGLYTGVMLLAFLQMASICVAMKILKLRGSLRESIWYMVAFISLKSYDFRLNHSSLRILFLCCAIFFSLVFALYSAFLTSALVRNPNLINSIEDLVNYGFTFFALPRIFRSIMKPEWHKTSLLGGLGPKGNNLSELESFKKVIEGGHVHIDALESYVANGKILKLTPDKLCLIIGQLPLPERSNNIISSGFFVPTNSTFRGRLNISILRLRNCGMLFRYNTIYSRYSSYVCPKIQGKYQKDLGLSHVGTPFIIILASIPMSILIILAEIHIINR